MGIASSIGLMTGATDVKAPGIGGVSRDFEGLMRSYLGQNRNVYENEAEFQPLYARLGYSSQAGLAPDVMRTLRAYNPEQAGLLDALANQAGDQLRAGGGLDPYTQRLVEQNIRG